LLSTKAIPGLGIRKKHVCEDFGASAGEVRIPVDRVRAHAGACASIDRRTGQRHAIEDDAGIEAESVAGSAREEEKEYKGSMKLPFIEKERGAKRFWQRRFYDFNVWSKGKTKEKLNYMHANSVARGLVKHPKEWMWSSGSFCELKRERLIRMDMVD
jgi:hypothetical protein